MPRNNMNPAHWSAFLRLIETVPTGRQVSCNTLRDLMAAADIPDKSRGGLFSQASKLGFLRPIGSRYEPSEGETAHRSVVRVYRRTSKQQPKQAAA